MDDTNRDSDAQPAGPPSPPPRLTPVTGTERVDSVDVLRGFALLGILTMNIYAFAMPFAAYMNPTVWGGSEPLNVGTWVVTHLLFDQKFMTIFSMLFGAGLILMAERAQTRGARVPGVYYRRTGWLIAFGLVHAYLIWFGDILFTYGVCGLLIYLFRRRSPKTLIIVGAVLCGVGLLASTGLGVFVDQLRVAAEEVAVLEERGEEPETAQVEMAKAWNDMQSDMAPGPEEIQRQIEVHRGGYVGILIERAPTVLMMQTFMLLTAFLWRIGGLMLVGMGLMKLGVFAARRAPGFYARMVVVGYAFGLPLAGFSAWTLFAHDFDPIYIFRVGGMFNYIGSILVALGHIGVVMLVCRSGVLAELRRRLAAVGRMALTNYLMHSVVLTLVFYGYGLGLFGSVDRFAQMGLVVGVWLLQLLWSPWWLARFRFGPAEWLWRSLTYARWQPMRRS